MPRYMASRFLWGLLLSAGLSHGQQIAITFDDLPAHGKMPIGVSRLQVVQSILATLEQEHLPPTYGFINGIRINEDPTSFAVLKAWRGAGQPLGNHTWAHKDYNKETPDQFEIDVTRNEPILKQLMTNDDWHWFRYPFLHEGETLLKRREARRWLAAQGYKIAEVNLDFDDSLWNAPYARCMDKHDEESIRFLHDSYLSVADQYYGIFRLLSQLVYGRDIKYVLLMHVGAFDAKMLPELLALYRSKGVRFVTLQDAISDPAYEDDPEIAEPSGGAQLELMMQRKQIPFPPNSKPYKQLDSMCR